MSVIQIGFFFYKLKDDVVHVYLLKDKELVDKSLPKGKEKKKNQSKGNGIET